jgi:hypothetical protein
MRDRSKSLRDKDNNMKRTSRRLLRSSLSYITISILSPTMLRRPKRRLKFSTVRKISSTDNNTTGRSTSSRSILMTARERPETWRTRSRL